MKYKRSLPKGLFSHPSMQYYIHGKVNLKKSFSSYCHFLPSVTKIRNCLEWGEKVLKKLGNEGQVFISLHDFKCLNLDGLSPQNLLDHHNTVYQFLYMYCRSSNINCAPNSVNLFNRQKALRFVGVWVLSKGVGVYDDAQLINQDIVNSEQVTWMHMDTAITVGHGL